jgi:hypothetical protein
MARGDPDRQVGRLAVAPPERERRPGLRAVGGAAARVAGPVIAGRGGGGMLGRLKAEWSAIAGAELAAHAWPEALSRAGALKLRVAPSFALELQHRTPLAIERINLFFGRGVVVRIALVQGPLPLPPTEPTPLNQSDSLSAAEATTLDARLAEIADPELRAALAGLGRLVLGGHRDD